MILRSVFKVAVFLLLVTVLAVPAMAQTELTGTTSGGAFYKILVPDGWQPADGLVIWNHGFSLSPIDPVEDLGPLVDVQLGEGYAVAASSYSLIGWALFETVSDNREMVDAFEAQFGVPGQIIVYGASLGGIVTAQAIEIGNLGNVVGALPFCGAMAGGRLWNGAVDLRLLYDNICGAVPGAAIPGGAFGLPFPLDPNFDENVLGLAINACTGILAPDDLRTPEQAARLAQILDVTQLPENFLLTVMGFATFGLADLSYDPRKLNGSLAFDNQNVDYGDAGVNSGIVRVSADPTATRRMVDNYTPTGQVGDIKIVSIHTDKDGLVLVENQNEYASVVPEENLTVGIVVEDVPSHCGFSAAELIAAWESLRGWIGGLPQPTAADLQTTCNSLVLAGLADGPCRIDPGFQVADLDGRVRPRNTCTPDNKTLCLGEGGRFQAQIVWRDFDGNTGDGQTAALQTEDTGSFYFFDDANVEMVLKTLDGRQENGNFWVFFGSLTNVSFDLTVTDMETGLVKVYSNDSGTFASVGDTAAF